MLEAMSCGCAVVTTETCAIPNFIQDGVNGYMSNDESELRNKLEYLLANPEKAREMGLNARRTILEKFSENKFIEQWNAVFDRVYKVRK
jgi:glycosyltransferase involved in cell wall biosynthesis